MDKIKMKPLEECSFGDNQLIGFYKDYAIAYSFEDEELYYFESAPIESMVGACVETELLRPVAELDEKVQEAICQEFLEG